MNAKQSLIAVFFMALWVLPAAAQQPPAVKGFYTGAGLGIGTVLAQDDDDWFTDTSYGDPDLAWVVTGGYRFGRYFALEGSYFDLGEPEYDDNLVEVREFNDIVDVDVDVDITVTQLSAMGILPFKIGRNVRAEFYFRGGAAFWDAESEQEIRSRTGGPTTRRTIDDDDVNFVFGFGGGFSFGKHWHLRLDYSNFAIEDDLLVLGKDDDAYADTTTFQLHYRFGDSWSY